MLEANGTARINFEGAEAQHCYFAVEQDSTGRIRGSIRVPIRLHDLESFPTIQSFSGNTEDGSGITIFGAVIESVALKSRGETKVFFYASEIRILRASVDGSPSKAKFFLTNFLFVGNRVYLSKSTRDTKYHKHELIAEIDNREVRFRPVPKYESISKSLKKNRDTRITSTMEFAIHDDEDMECVQQFAARVLQLISLARGTKINWTYYNLYASNRIIEVRHHNRITKRYSSLFAIQDNPDKELVGLLEECFEAYIEKLEDWKIDRTIDAICDSKQEGDYLENRALKSVAVLEYLNSRFQSERSTGFEIDPAEFEKKEAEVQAHLRDVLSQTFDPANKMAIDRICQKVKGLNRMSFQRSIKEMHRTLKLAPDKSQIHQAVAVRNSLIHELTFENEIEKSNWEKYRILIALNDKITLALLNYKGQYHDWHNDTKQALPYIENMAI